MKNVGKKLGSLFLAFAILLTAVVCDVTPVQAASSTTYAQMVATESGSATMGTECKVPFTLDSNTGFVMSILVPAPVSVDVTVYNVYGNAVSYKQTIPDSMFELVQIDETHSAYAAYEEFSTSFPSGDYSYGLKFSQDTSYVLMIHQYSTASIQSKATITAGFTKKLSVSGAKVKKWESRNKSIATVDKNGKVTAKKKGKTKIIATLADGKTKLECIVTVAENKYKETKAHLSECPYGKVYCSAYTAYFDKSGNLVVKAHCANNSGKKIQYFKNVKVTVKNANNKTVAKYSNKKVSTTVAIGSEKDLTFTIKKSDLKNKKIDLRNATIEVDGSYIYYTYY